MRGIEKHIFLLLAALAAGLSVLCFFLLEQNAPGATDEQYVSAVQQRVKDEMLISNAELDTVSSLLKRDSNPTFTKLFELPAKYPYFIFHNSELVYWSDYRVIPGFSEMASVSTLPKLIQFDQGRYIVSHRRVTTGEKILDVFSLVNIYRSYHSTNSYLQSGYNQDLFAIDPLAIVEKRQRAYQAVYDNQSAFLFSIVPPKVDAFRNHSTPVNTVILATLAVIFLGLYVFQLMIDLKEQRQYGWGLVSLTVYLVLLRAVMLYFGVPFLFIESDLFNAKYYAASVVNPSLGDLLLNSLVVTVLTFYWVRHYYRSQLYLSLVNLSYGARLILSVVCVVFSYLAFLLYYTELNNIYDKSQFTLDITLNIHFSLLKGACLAVFVVISCLYFLVVHLLSSLFLRFNRFTHVGVGALLIAAGTGLSVGIWFLAGQWPDGILLLNGFYFLIVYVSKLPKTLYTFRYTTSVYLFLAAFVCAFITAYVVYNQEIRRQLTNQQQFASHLLAENDSFGEFLMNKAQESIKWDSEIGQLLQTDTLLVRERIQQRVKSLHLDKYFDKYDVEVFSFRADGRPLDIGPSPISLGTFRGRYLRPNYRTEYPDVYFISELGNQFIKQYVCFVAIQKPPVLSGVVRKKPAAPDTLGYVVMNLRLRNDRIRSGYPEMLVDTKFTQDPDMPEYSYAFYSGSTVGRPSKARVPQHQLLYSGAGTYNYDRKLDLSLLNNPALFTSSVWSNKYRHVAQQGKNGRIVVVSSPEYPFRNIFSNFSFLYLLLVFTVILAILGYAINYRFFRLNINYSTRIQILLNLAFFMPLIFVVLIILGVISSTYIDNQKDSYISNTRNIATNFLPYLEEFNVQKRSKASMEEELGKIARNANIDINLFDTQGQLNISTSPFIYESGYLSKRINPEAYIHIIEDKENQVLLDESLGGKNYRTAYAGVKTLDGRLLGVLSIPYFYAQPELDREIIEVIATSLSIFTALFMFFLVLSYFASHMLTKPLRLLTQKVKRTNLELPNDPLLWQSDDEIGLLIREYNRMLLKLEESKQALAQTEKQSAWREMAKQVAHEIKNPLTPMKLTLQHLQRTFPNSGTAGTSDPARGIILRTFDSLLDQIDNLSDIATSFSEFAKMPLPKREQFEVTGVFNKTVDLYADDVRISLQREVEPGPIMAIGDRQLIGRILTNLLINAIQSVPPDRKPLISVKLYKNSDAVQIEIHDNGSGIPEPIRNKVFLANFSTKRGGSGLGLAIAKRGVEHAGGTIWFETTDDVGTSFFVSLPLAGVPGQLNGESITY